MEGILDLPQPDQEENDGGHWTIDGVSV